MQTFLKLFQSGILFFFFGILSISAHPRVIKGTVYRDGKPASGVQVTAHKSAKSYFTSFDGKYELKISLKSRWVKFKFPDKEEKLEINANSGDIIDFGVPSKSSLPGTTQPGKSTFRTKPGSGMEINSKQKGGKDDNATVLF
jgi:hypothetical protein